MDQEEQSKCMQLPIFDPKDTDETFQAKVVALKKRPKFVESPPAHEPMVYLQIGVPTKLYEAYRNSEQMLILEATLHEAEAKLRCALIAKYVGRSK